MKNENKLKIEVKERAGNGYYDEVLYIITNYNSFIKNPNIKAKRLSFSCFIYGALSIIMMLLFSVLYFTNRDSRIYLFVVGLFGLILILSILYYLLIRKRIDSYRKMNGSFIFTFDDKKIICSNELDKKELLWDDVKNVLVNTNSICFLTKGIDNAPMTVSISFKEEVYKILKKLNKEDIIIDNLDK